MGRRYRLYPTPGQAERLTGWGHTCRAVWNVALAQRRGLLGVCLDGFSTAPDALDSDRGGTTTPAWSGAPPGPAVPLGKTIQPGEIFGPDAPHHRGDRPAPSATDAPSSRLHPQAHHRPRQTPRPCRNRGPAGEGHDCQCQGHHQQPGGNARAKAGLNRAVLDDTPGERRRQLVYQAPLFGSELLLVPPQATSQTCAACSHRDPASRPGCGRLFACTVCGHQAHADANAARNIERLAAGRAVDSTRSHPRVARPPRSRMREPIGSAV
jgi:putative transposase-like DNA-binding protein/helix-turn-helix protein